MSVKYLEGGNYSNSEKLLASYNYVGVSWTTSQISLDVNTDIITITNHGLVNGDIVSFGVLNQDNVPIHANATGTALYVINSTTDTFQLSTTNGGASVNFTSAGVPNTWKLFKAGITEIAFTNINYKKVRIKVKGNAMVGTGASRVSIDCRSSFSVSQSAMPVSSSSRPDFFDAEIILEVNNYGTWKMLSAKGMAYVRGMLAGGGVNYQTLPWGYGIRVNTPYDTIDNFKILPYGNMWFCDGTSVEVYGIE